MGLEKENSLKPVVIDIKGIDKNKFIKFTKPVIKNNSYLIGTLILQDFETEWIHRCFEYISIKQ